jgi:assimilatory nitrate reductase catalytic subunit
MSRTGKQPELKHAAVKIVKAELPWRYVVFGWVAPERAVALQAALRPSLRAFAYASCVLFGRERVGVLLRAGDDYAAAAAIQNEIEARFGIAGSQVLRYDDPKRGNARHILVQDGALAAVALAGDTAAEDWLRQYLEQGLPVAALGRALLSPSNKAPQGLARRGRIICNCLNVSETEIGSALDGIEGDPDATLAALQAKLKCGTSCGSCVPEIKRMVWGRKGEIGLAA